MAGVVLGIVIGTAVKAVAGPVPGGSGAVAIGVAAAVALGAALVLGGGFFEQGVLFVNQSVTSAILMIAVAGAATGSERLSDALIGGGVTLMITVILFPAAPLPLIEDAVREVFGALRDTLARLAELAGAGEMPGPEWAMAAGQRIQGQLTGLEQARSSALQVVSLAPRRWPQRSRVRVAGEQTAPLELLAATVLSLAHVGAAGSAGVSGPAPSRGLASVPLRAALGELASAFAALADGGPTAGAQAAARHAARARGLVTGAALPPGPHAQLIARLAETCADDTLRLVARRVTLAS